jgi:hypothetical protein
MTESKKISYKILGRPVTTTKETLLTSSVETYHELAAINKRLEDLIMVMSSKSDPVIQVNIPEILTKPTIQVDVPAPIVNIAAPAEGAKPPIVDVMVMSNNKPYLLLIAICLYLHLLLDLYFAYSR